MSKKATAPENDGMKKGKPLHAKKAAEANASKLHQGELSDAELGTVGGGVNPATVSLMKSCVKGSHIKEATIKV